MKTVSTNYNDFTAAITLKAQDETLGSITLANTVAGSGADQALAFRYTVQLQDETARPTPAQWAMRAPERWQMGKTALPGRTYRDALP